MTDDERRPADRRPVDRRPDNTRPVDRRYDERLAAPLWVWVAALTVAVIVAATLHSGASGLRSVLPYVVMPIVAVGGVIWVSRGRITVAAGRLTVPGARIEVDRLGEVTPLGREGTRQLRGPLALPGAFVSTRGWLAGSVQVQLVDLDDDTPYWLVGTRHPERLAAALRR